MVDEKCHLILEKLKTDPTRFFSERQLYEASGPTTHQALYKRLAELIAEGLAVANGSARQYRITESGQISSI